MKYKMIIAALLTYIAVDTHPFTVPELIFTVGCGAFMGTAVWLWMEERWNEWAGR